MELRLEVAVDGQRTRMVRLGCDVTATVGDLARALVRAGMPSDTALTRVAATRSAPLALLGRAGPTAHQVLLDPAAPIASSGLQSGWIIEAVREDAVAASVPRAVASFGTVEICSGEQRGARYSLVAGPNAIGRDRRSRIHLDEPGVSRRHATIEVGDRVVLRDHGSANGSWIDGRAVTEAPLAGVTEVEFGTAIVRVELTGAPVPQPVPMRPAATHPHTRAPRVAPRFPHSERTLPAPPAPSSPGRLPLIGLLAPAVLGVAMYALTGSAISLLMIAFSPLLMLGSWFDGRFGGTRAARREGARFRAALQEEHDELRQLGLREVQMRAEESPSMTDIAEAIRARGPLLWTRRPEHRAFLELRLGEGRLPSRTVVVPPERGEALPEHWAEVRECAAASALVGPVPVLERFVRSGSIGVAGDAEWAQGCVRSLVMQLVGLHSPAELVLACFGAPTSWQWLAWLPQVDPPASPLSAWPLAGDPASAARLITALEGVLAMRCANERAPGTARSQQSAAAVRAEAEAVPPPPPLPAIIVLVCDTRDIDPARLIALAEHGPDVGIHLIWMAERATLIPAACRTLLEIERGSARVLFSRSSETVELSRVEFLDAAAAEGLARSLAPVVDIGCRPRHQNDLPSAAALRDLHPVELLGGGDAILEAWRASGTLTGEWIGGAERPAVSLAAVVGQGAAGPLSLDLREHGPHALVAGTTGSGKSELLQSWIMSLAARVGPDRLTFLLVDYKGGAAFAECARLPHAVGLLTDLDTHLVRRALASLRAEVRFREELLARHGAKDLIALERRSVAAAPPALVIVIDEFAALSREVPEFVPGIIDIAQRGRSLGLHLILATQRPAGVITDQLRANTNLRIALRMADASDSTDVLGALDAAHFDPAHPGRAAVRIGGGSAEHFQTGYLGGNPEAAGTPDLALQPLGLGTGEEWHLPPEPMPPHSGSAVQRDIARVLESITAASTAAACPPPRRPWLDPLPAVIALHALATLETDPLCTGESDTITIGLSDLPSAQRQAGFTVDLERVGNLALVGASGTGKSSALLTCAAALSTSAAALPVRIFAIDAAGGGLEALRSLPTVAAVAPLGDAELVDRVLRHLSASVGERGERFAELRAGSLRAFQRMDGCGSEPRIVLLIDGFAALRAADDAPGAFGRRMGLLTEIMHAGRAVGVHVILTADRAGVLPPALAATVQEHLVFRLAGVADYAHFGISSDMLAQAPAGRAVVAGAGIEVQLALPSERQDHGAQAAALESLAGSLRRAGVVEVPKVENPPRSIPVCSLPPQFAGEPVIGVDTRELTPLTMPTRGLAVVAGPAGAGLTTAMRTVAAAHARWCRAAGVQGEQVLLSLSLRSPLGRCRWDRLALGAEQVVDTAGALVAALADAADESASQHRLIVVEGAVEAESATVLAALSALARAARRAQSLVVFEYELGHAAGVWELLGELRHARWGISLQPDDADSGSPLAFNAGRLRRGDLPPGRGFAVDGGRAVPVQLASAWGSLED